MESCPTSRPFFCPRRAPVPRKRPENLQYFVLVEIYFCLKRFFCAWRCGILAALIQSIVTWLRDLRSLVLGVAWDESRNRRETTSLGDMGPELMPLLFRNAQMILNPCFRKNVLSRLRRSTLVLCFEVCYIYLKLFNPRIES